jgi:protein O-mannosyl-transferase
MASRDHPLSPAESSHSIHHAPVPAMEQLGALPLWFIPAVVASVLLVYWPAVQAGFIWDDDAHVTAPALRSVHGLWRIWTEAGATQQYYPLLHSFFWVQNKLWGGAPLGYHVVNIGLHALDAVLLALALRRLAVPGALLAALIFALHPVHAESVAWISEQKNTLSALFFLSAALAYFRFDAAYNDTASDIGVAATNDISARATPRIGTRWYAVATVLFAAALLTKTVTATLPATLLVIAWWRRGRISWKRDVALLLPWFCLALVAAWVTTWVERTLIGAEGMAFDLSLAQRALLAGRVLWFYLGKLCWPNPLVFIYPRWTLDPSIIWQWIPLGAALTMGVVLWSQRGRSRAMLAAALIFAGTLFPALGFFNVYPFLYSFVADHFLYLASIAPIAMFATLATVAARRITPAVRSVLVLVTLGTLGWLTRQETHTYHDPETLYRATLRLNPQCWMAANNLGKHLMVQAGKVAEAIPLLRTALKLRPDYAEAENNLGLALAQSGQAFEAIPHLQRALALKPMFYQAYNNLGIAFARSGDLSRAATAFSRAVELAPGAANVEENLAKTFQALGRTAEAQEHFARAAELRRSAP